ncbi:MAG: DnaA/Hda family protein [Lacipirellulaceae bacterium]
MESKIRQALHDRLGADRYQLWIGQHVAFSLREDCLQVVCPSQAELDWLRRKLGKEVKSVSSAVLGQEFTVDYQVDEASEVATTQPLLPGLSSESSESKASASEAATAPVRRTTKGVRVRRDLENFVPGKSNKLALETIKAVIESPGRFSPLLIYGPLGTGKTHLLDAAAAGLRRNPARPQVLRLTCEEFTAEFMEALRTKTTTSFRQKFRGVDVLLVDDVHFLGTKRATIEEFLYTIDAINTRGGQVILTSKASPNELQSIDPGLSSRVAGGMSAPLAPPDYETRIGIVRVMAARTKTKLSEPVIEMIAKQVIGSARLLSGALNRLVVTSMAERRPITPINADMVLSEFCQQNTPQVNMIDVEKAVCEVFGTESKTLKSASKARHITDPRMLCLCLSRRFTRAGLSEISSYYNRRSHTAVLSAQKRLEKMIGDDAEVVVAEGACHVEEALRRVEAALRRA